MTAGGEAYRALFARLRAAREIALVPFVVLGDPDPGTSLTIMEALVAAGADALELGIPFSDPIADGPAVQAGNRRALEAGVTPSSALELVRRLRERGATLPIGLLTYANLGLGRGLHAFYAEVRRAGVDSVLVADVPSREVEPWAAAARQHEVAPVLIAPPNLTERTAQAIGQHAEGYTYVVTRAGVTGADDVVAVDHRALLDRLSAAGAPPPMLGFGISRPEHVAGAARAGAAGAIVGSALLGRIEAARAAGGDLAPVRAFIAELKRATRIEA